MVFYYYVLKRLLPDLSLCDHSKESAELMDISVIYFFRVHVNQIYALMSLKSYQIEKIIKRKIEIGVYYI